MTSDSPGKPPPSPRSLSMIFSSSDFAKLLESKDMDASKLFESNESAAALFRSADFLKSLDAYKEAMENANGQDNADDRITARDPASLFRSAEFIKSLETLSKEGGKDGTVDPATVFRSLDFLKSLDSLSKGSDSDAKQTKKEFLRSRDWAGKLGPADVDVPYSKSMFQSKESTAKASPVGSMAAAKRAKSKDYFTSQDWMSKYEPGHVDVSYDRNMFKSSDSEAGKAVATAVAVSPSAAVTSTPAPSSASKWKMMYEDGLNSGDPSTPDFGAAVAAANDAPEVAATLAGWKTNYKEAAPSVSTSTMPPLTGSAQMLAVAPATVPAPVAVTDAVVAKAPAAKQKKKRIYKSRKVIPEVKTYVDYTDKDVLLGRGGLSNKHPGNKRYREEIENAKAVYRSAAKDEKTEWASLLVQYVQKDGGRFLEKEKETGKWYIVPDVVARRKAGQALREDNTPESRKEKRDRYKKRHGKE